jgi:hypothetical protein
MSERDDIDPMFDELVRATRAELDRRIDASAPLPDLAAVFQRAHELDPQLVDEDTLAYVSELAPVVPLRAWSSEPSDELASFTAALRDQLEAGVAERRTREIPTPSFARPRPLTRRHPLSWVAAAIVLVLFGGVVSATIGGGELLGSESARGNLLRAIESLVERDEPEPDEPIEHLDHLDQHGESPALVEDPAPEQPIAQLEQDSEPSSQPAPRKRRRSNDADIDELAELDARAQALWRAGDLDGAEQLFRELVRRGKRGRWAQLAYGELFSLAQRHPAEQREALWRDYLATFPNGRYAEDARAGLCRRAAGSERVACWSDYITRHPEGTHAEEARRALEP